MKKKLLSVIALICLITGIVSASVSAEEVQFANEKKFLLNLGITNGIDMEKDAYITRAEFTAMVVRSINLSGIGVSETVFSDVSEDNPYKEEIYAARSLRITNGTGPNTFSPDDNLSFMNACKMLCIALGYEQKAEFSGGYPTGYAMTAQSIGLTKGLENNSGYLTFNQAARMIYNALYSNVMVQTGITSDEMNYKKSEENLLEYAFSLTRLEGVVSTSGYISDSDLYADDDVIEINGITLKTVFDTDEYIGLRVNAWYDSDTKTLAAVDVDGINKVEIINAVDIIDFDNFILSVDDGDSSPQKYNFDKSFAFIKNGRIISHTEEDFSFEGSGKIIDNNGDNKYDYFLADSCQYFVVDHADLVNEVIYDADSPLKCIDFSDENTKSVKLYIKQADGTLSAGDITDIAEGSAIEVYISDDKSVCKIITAGKNIITEEISEIGDDYILIGDTKYKTNTYFDNKKITLNFGLTYKFILAPDNSITSIDEATESDISYGYLIGFARDRGIANIVKILLVTSNNKKEVYTLAKNICIDGKNMQSSNTEIDSLFLNGEYPKYQLIRYALNKAGEVSVIDIAESGEISDNLQTKYPSNNSLTCYGEKLLIRYRTDGKIAIPNFLLENATVFTVPTELLELENTYYDEEMFLSETLSALTNDIQYTIDAYDVDANYYPKAIVVYKNAGGKKSVTPTTGSTLFIVQKINNAINEGGIMTKKIYGFTGNKYVEYIVGPDVLETLEAEGKIPAKGDIVRVALSMNNEIIGIANDVTFSDDGSFTPTINYGQNEISNEPTNKFSYISGEVITSSAASVVLKADQTPSNATEYYIDNIAPIALNSPSITVYDTNSGEIYKGSLSDLYPRNGKRAYAVCKLSYYRCNALFIYLK